MKKNENGRSMVEMLGVLAIVGVLSLTGIQGYTIAMRKYRANEIVQMASFLSIMAQSANAGEGECIKLSETGFTSTVAGVDVDMVANPAFPPPNVSIQIQDQEDYEEICNMVTSAAEGIVDVCGADGDNITCDLGG